jgi:hypothetical protein
MKLFKKIKAMLCIHDYIFSTHQTWFSKDKPQSYRKCKKCGHCVAGWNWVLSDRIYGNASIPKHEVKK